MSADADTDVLKIKTCRVSRHVRKARFININRKPESIGINRAPKSHETANTLVEAHPQEIADSHIHQAARSVKTTNTTSLSRPLSCNGQRATKTFLRQPQNTTDRCACQMSQTNHHQHYPNMAAEIGSKPSYLSHTKSKASKGDRPNGLVRRTHQSGSKQVVAIIRPKFRRGLTPSLATGSI
ncbi:hypothetical protein EVAR_848_1 [Eumeta japonica]|uniref:Uncharacterized protein n=1 Tax=Eumeta variegata TaxID=151549 RepID=A0A4C1SDW0_EUMVA|nr:hypothetical protein EVAR_848_1 [Eumeta japonica]